MKPLNLDNRPCSPISSNCVVWQGPTLTCIDLCTGDTISDVVAKLAEELCTLLDQTNVTNYDLTCLGITACGPKDFQALIQLLINKICELNNIEPQGQLLSASECPSCIVSVAPCFVQNGQTTMQLVDYVQMIANKICDILEQIGDLQDQINNLNIRVTALEEAAPPSFTLPSITVDCDLGQSSNGTTVNSSVSRTIDIVLDALINDNTHGYCAYTAILGSISDLNTGIGRKCVTDGTNLLSAPGTYGSLTQWVPDASYDTVADAINNIWLVICDMFAYVATSTVSVQDTNSVNLTVTGGVISADIIDSGWKNLEGFNFYTGSMASSKPQCRRIGNQIHFRGTVVIPINDGSGGIVPLASTNAYNNVYRVTPFVGANGVIYDAQNRILFNSNGGSALSVIPTSVVDAGTNLDNQYNGNQLLAIRKLDVPQTLGSASTGAATLTAAVNVTLLQNKTLRIAPLTTIEQEPTDIISFPGNSLLRSLTSSFTPRSWMIDFRNYIRDLDGNMSTSQPTINGLLAGGIVVGQLYRIENYAPGDDFTNIGAVTNGNNQTFIATGIAPATWTTTELIPLSRALHYNTFYNTVGPTFLGTQWPTLVDLTTPDFDAAASINLGGFTVKLDGLIAYLDPCNTSILSKVPCP